MTIAIGILTSEGVVVGADSEESFGHVKADHLKIGAAFYAAESRGDCHRIALITGAGSGHHIDAFAQRFDIALSEPRFNTADPLPIFDEILGSFYDRFIGPMPAREDNEIEIVMAYCGSGGTVDLYVSKQNLFVRCGRHNPPYACVGYGAPQATLLLKKLLPDAWRPNVRQACLIAAYVLYSVKTSVAFCGKRSDIRVLATGHSLSTVIPPDMERLERAVSAYSEEFEFTAFRAAIGVWSPDRVEKKLAELRRAFETSLEL